MEIHARYFFMSLIQEGIHIVSCPPLENIGGQLFRQIEGFDVFEAVIEHFGPQEVFEVSHDFCHIFVYCPLPLKCFEDHDFYSDFPSLDNLSPFEAESQGFQCSHGPFLNIPF